MAKLVATKNTLVADVAGGKGYLKAALRERGFTKVTTIDKRHRLAKGRPGQRWGFFTVDTQDYYALVLGMHPDEATDHILLYASARNVPFAVCPCCITPSGTIFNEVHKFSGWINHLKNLVSATHFVQERTLPMTGKNLVLVGRPKKRR